MTVAYLTNAVGPDFGAVGGSSEFRRIVGALLTGVLATAAINPAGANASLLNQAVGLLAVVAWSALGTFAVLMVCKFTTGLRVATDEEIEGLDYTQHGETLHP